MQAPLSNKYSYLLGLSSAKCRVHTGAFCRNVTAQRNKGFRGSYVDETARSLANARTCSGGVTSYPLTFAEKPTVAWNGRAANRTVANVTATSSTHAHALLRYGRMRKCGHGFRSDVYICVQYDFNVRQTWNKRTSFFRHMIQR
jgi:hypothetical protein